MTVNKRKKSGRFRASRTHGVGTKKARGSGNRGGKGKAGTGKRADHKKPTIINEYGNDYFGRKGFVKKNARVLKPIKLSLIDKKIEKWAKEGKATVKNNVYTLDLAKLGYNKLLGNGTTSKKLDITVDYTSKSAAEKVKKAGGNLNTKVQSLPAEEEEHFSEEEA